MNYARQLPLLPSVIGLSAVLLNASNNSNAFGVAGFNLLSIDIDHTFAAATVITFYLDRRRRGTTTWHRLKIEVATSAAGVSDIQARQFSIATGSASGGHGIDIEINCDEMRIAALTGTGATASDLATVYVTLGVV